MLPARVFLTFITVILLMACGGAATSTASPTSTPEAVKSVAADSTASPASTPEAVKSVAADSIDSPASTPEAVKSTVATSDVPLWRYVNSGWVSPYRRVESGVFSQQLRAFVIANQAELDEFQRGFTMKRSWGTTTSLGRVDFPNSVLLAAYYLWRPYQGDPLSVIGFSLEGHRADVLLDLEESPQGKEYPFLFAPMTMVTVDRSYFPVGEAVEFVFHLNGEPQATVVATME